MNASGLFARVEKTIPRDGFADIGKDTGISSGGSS
jgi:hypothetical protein